MPSSESKTSQDQLSDNNSSHNLFKNKWRNIFWPITKDELKHFLPMSALMFCVLFNQNILRILKDSILISEVSAEITSFTKLYCVTPCAALFVIIYAKMVNHLSFDRIFYILISVFVSFYLIFAFIIYPQVDFFHMNLAKQQFLMEKYPHFKWYIALVANWSYVLFYTLSELWPNIFYVLLFWQLANEITSTNQAKRFYTLFALFGNSSLIIVGLIMMSISSDASMLRFLFTESDDKILLAKTSVMIVLFFTIIACIIVRYISNNIIYPIKKSRLYLTPKDKKIRMTVVQSFKYIIKSKYLWLMLICTASFGLSMNLVEAVWKAKMKELYPSVNSYAAINSMYIMWTGVIILVMTIIGNNIMRLKGWFAAAIISPLMILITGTLFFTFVVFDDYASKLMNNLVLMSPLALAVFFGGVQNILSKGTKYSIWDAARQMLYIPLSNELKVQGKAAVDILSPKIGKSANGLIQSVIFTIMPFATYNSIASFLMIVFIVICAFWIYAVKAISIEYNKLIDNNPEA